MVADHRSRFGGIADRFCQGSASDTERTMKAMRLWAALGAALLVSTTAPAQMAPPQPIPTPTL
jgi:hypothetical protein